MSYNNVFILVTVFRFLTVTTGPIPELLHTCTKKCRAALELGRGPPFLPTQAA